MSTFEDYTTELAAKIDSLPMTRLASQTRADLERIQPGESRYQCRSWRLGVDDGVNSNVEYEMVETQIVVLRRLGVGETEIDVIDKIPGTAVDVASLTNMLSTHTVNNLWPSNPAFFVTSLVGGTTTASQLNISVVDIGDAFNTTPYSPVVDWSAGKLRVWTRPIDDPTFPYPLSATDGFRIGLSSSGGTNGKVWHFGTDDGLVLDQWSTRIFTPSTDANDSTFGTGAVTLTAVNTVRFYINTLTPAASAGAIIVGQLQTLTGTSTSIPSYMTLLQREDFYRDMTSVYGFVADGDVETTEVERVGNVLKQEINVKVVLKPS